MNKQYNVDDILNEIKSKKARQNIPNRPAPRPERPRPSVLENIDENSFHFSVESEPVPAAAPTRSTTSAPKSDPEPVRPQSVQTAAPPKPAASSHDTCVFFNSISNHHEAVKTQHQEQRLELMRQMEEERLREEERNAEKLRLLEEASKPAPDVSVPPEDELTNSFFLEQQPAELPVQEGSTPFGDFEPVTPPPEQPDPSLEDKTEYQKFFSKLKRSKTVEVPQPEAPAEPSEPLPDAGPLLSEDTQDDLFASTPTGLTEEFAAAQIFTKSAQEKNASGESNEKRFHVNLPDDFDLEEKPKENAGAPAEPKKNPEPKKSGLFHHHDEPQQTPASRLASADIPVPDDFADADEEIEDYTSPKDKDAILHDMKSIKTGLLIRIVLMVVLFSVSLYLALAARDIQIGDELLPLPTFIQPEIHLRSYMSALCVISAIGALICSNTIGGGLLALLKFHANTDTLPMLALLGTFAQGICYIVKPEYFSVDKADFGSNLYLFFPVALFILLFNLVGKMLVILRIQNNFKLVSSEKRKNAAVFLKDRTLLRDISKGLSMEEYTIAYPETSRFLANFLDNSYSEDHAENMSRVLAPICLLAGIILAVLSYLFNKNIAEAVSTFTAIMCVSAPLTSTIAANLPLYRMSRRLIPSGAMVSGYSAVDAFSRTEAVVLDAKDLFRPADIILHGIKPFDQGKIDSVILDAASVVCNTDGMLTDVFNKIISSNKSMLRPVENVTYEDSMGLSAWVDGKRVLIGNRELMVNHGVEIPSNDYEMRFVKDSKNIVYLANSGQLSAMFVISYRPNHATKEQLDALASKGMYLIINTSDPNITAEKIHAVYDFPLELIKLLPAKFHDTYNELTSEKERSPAKIGFVGSNRMMVTAILDCMTAKTAIDQAVLIQMIALVVGYALVALFSLMGNLSMLSILHLILFQCIWAVIGTVIPNLKKY